MRPGPKCPNCAEPFPLWRLRWIGRPIRCARCDTALILPMWIAGVWGGIGGTAFSLLRHSVPQTLGSQIGLLALVIAIIMPLYWLTARVRPAPVR